MAFLLHVLTIKLRNFLSSLPHMPHFPTSFQLLKSKKMNSFVKVALVAALATASANAETPRNLRASSTNPPVWTSVPTDSANYNILINTVGNPQGYAPFLNKHLCVSEVQGVKEVVFNGLNYEFLVRGCALPATTVMGQCGDYQCERENFIVTINTQPYGPMIVSIFNQ